MINELSTAVISCIIRDGSCLSDIALTESDFKIETHRAIFSAACQLESSKEPIDVISIAELLQKQTGKNWIKLVGDTAQGSFAQPKSVSAYAEKLRAHVQAEQINIIASKISQKALSGDIDIDKELGELMRVSVPDSKHDWTLKETLNGAIDLIQESMGSNGTVGIPTGLSEIDKALGGFHDTDLYIIGARPSIGKTSLLLNMAISSNVNCGVISTEQGHAQVGQRFLSSEGRVSGMRMRSAAVDDDECARLYAAIGRLQDRNIFINDKSYMTISELSRQARKWVFDYDIKILFVDYLQRIKADNLKIPKHEQVDQVVTGLKTLAKELGIPVVSLAQVNREVEKRPDKRPRMGDLKDSGAVEQEADVIMMLYRDWVYNQESNPSLAELSIEKNRHGATGIIICTFEREFMRFTDLANETGYYS